MDDCTQCETGKYCVASIVAGECAAGYICNSGATSPTPYGLSYAYECPISHYCVEGTTYEVACPDGLYTLYTGAR
jgi:hypothetical protein